MGSDLSTVYRPPSFLFCGTYNVWGRLQSLWVYDNTCCESGFSAPDDLCRQSMADIGTSAPKRSPLSFIGNMLRIRAVKIDIMGSIGNNFDDLGHSHQITTTLVLAASIGASYHTGERWLEVFMKVLAGGHVRAAECSGYSVVSVDPKSDDLIIAFIQCSRFEVLSAMRLHGAEGSFEREDWWSQHAEFETICPNEDLLPTRRLFDELFAVFDGMYPALPRKLANLSSRIRNSLRHFGTLASSIGPGF